MRERSAGGCASREYASAGEWVETERAARGGTGSYEDCGTYGGCTGEIRGRTSICCAPSASSASSRVRWGGVESSARSYIRSPDRQPNNTGKEQTRHFDVVSGRMSGLSRASKWSRGRPGFVGRQSSGLRQHAAVAMIKGLPCRVSTGASTTFPLPLLRQPAGGGTTKGRIANA